MKQHFISSTFILILLSHFSYSQNYSYRQYTTEDGLPTNYVYGVLEDQKGYIWAFTENGVSKFDGHEFKNFSVKDGLTYNDIVFMEEDSAGVLWLHGLHNDIQYIKNDSIYTFKGLEYKGVIIVRKYFCNADTENAQYFVRNKNPNSEVVKLNNGKIIDTLSFRKPDSLFTDFSRYFKDVFSRINHNRSYNASKDCSIYYEIINDSLHSWKLEEPLDCFFTPIDCIIPYNISISENKMVFLDILSRRYKKILFSELFGETPKEVSLQMQGSNLILQTSLGYAEFDIEWSLIDLIIYEKTITQYGVKRSIKDSHGNLWVGTRDAGLLQFTKSQLQNSIITSPLSENQSFNKLYLNEKGEILSLSDNAEVCQIKNDNIIHLTKLEMGSAHIRNVTPGPENKLIIANSVKAVIFDGQETCDLINDPYFKNFESTFTKSELKYFRRFDDLYFNENKSQLFCSYPEAKAQVFTKKYDYFIKKDLNIIGKLFFHDTINNILYLSGSEGLYRIDEKLNHTLELKLRAITSFFTINEHSYLIGTESDGLYHYQRSSKELTKLNDHSYIRKITREGPTYFLASNEGVLVGNIEDRYWKPVYIYNKKDGLQSEEIRDILIHNNYIYATSFKGIIKLDKKAVEEYEKLSLTNGALSIKEIYSISKHADIVVKNPQLAYNENDISFKYLLQNYNSNGEIKYKYKLDPIQSEWQSTTERTQQFFNLQAAHYTLHLKATDAFGHDYYLNEPYTFTIKNPFWERWWFITTGILLIVFGIFRFIKIKTDRTAREVQLEKELNNKIASFKIEALRSQMNPHFVFNALSSIQYYIQKNNVQEADKYLTMFGGLIRKYLDFSQVKTINIKQEIDLLNDYLRLEEMRFESLFTTEIIVDPKLDIHYSYIPTMLVQPYVENAINHGLQQRRDGKGILWIEFKKIYTDGLRISINDNGIGIQNSKNNKSGFHESHGMSNIMDRISFLKESESLEIKLQIKTISNNKQFPGTQIVIEIKEL